MLCYFSLKITAKKRAKKTLSFLKCVDGDLRAKGKNSHYVLIITISQYALPVHVFL